MDGMQLIEDGDVPVVESDVRSTLQRQFESRPVRVDHPLYKPDAPWPCRTDVWCFHCCHPFSTMPVPLVARYDHDRHLAVCFGNFCSPNCGRAYAQEHRPMSWGQAMVFYTHILSECFGIPVDSAGRSAWPKERLRVFGGDLTIEEFRAGFATPLVLRVENVAFCMQNLSIFQVLPAEGMSFQADSTAENERQRLHALAAHVIDTSRSKHTERAVQHDQGEDEDDNDDEYDDEDGEDNDGDSSGPAGVADQGTSSGYADSACQASSASVLATFLANMKVYKGDESAARSAMLFNGAVPEVTDAHRAGPAASFAVPVPKRKKTKTAVK